MTNFPDEIIIRILNKKNNKPIKNVIGHIILFANKKNNYGFFTNLSDINGIISITKDWLKKQIDRETKTAIMDFSSNLEDCKSYIDFSILNQKIINKALLSLDSWAKIDNEFQIDVDNLRMAEDYKYKPYKKVITIDENTETQNETILLEKKLRYS